VPSQCPSCPRLQRLDTANRISVVELVSGCRSGPPRGYLQSSYSSRLSGRPRSAVAPFFSAAGFTSMWIFINLERYFPLLHKRPLLGPFTFSALYPLLIGPSLKVSFPCFELAILLAGVVFLCQRGFLHHVLGPPLRTVSFRRFTSFRYTVCPFLAPSSQADHILRSCWLSPPSTITRPYPPLA